MDCGWSMATSMTGTGSMPHNIMLLMLLETMSEAEHTFLVSATSEN